MRGKGIARGLGFGGWGDGFTVLTMDLRYGGLGIGLRV